MERQLSRPNDALILESIKLTGLIAETIDFGNRLVEKGESSVNIAFKVSNFFKSRNANVLIKCKDRAPFDVILYFRRGRQVTLFFDQESRNKIIFKNLDENY